MHYLRPPFQKSRRPIIVAERIPTFGKNKHSQPKSGNCFALWLTSVMVVLRDVYPNALLDR